MKIRHTFSALALLAIAGTTHAQGVSPQQARSWAAGCANCHGTNGQAQPGLASLAGASKDETVQKMKEFKSGTRPATLMHQLAKGYTDEQIEAIAAYFAAQKK
jgi:cytochrome c553